MTAGGVGAVRSCRVKTGAASDRTAGSARRTNVIASHGVCISTARKKRVGPEGLTSNDAEGSVSRRL